MISQGSSSVLAWMPLGWRNPSSRQPGVAGHDTVHQFQDPFTPDPARLTEGHCERCKQWSVINPEYGVCEECFDPEKDVKPGGPRFRFECGSTESRRARTRRDGTGRVNPAVGFLDGAKVRNADTADCTDSSQPSDWPALNSLPRKSDSSRNPSCAPSLSDLLHWVNGDCAPVRPAVVLSDATASISCRFSMAGSCFPVWPNGVSVNQSGLISAMLTDYRSKGGDDGSIPSIDSTLHGTGVENGKPAQDQRFGNSEEFAPELLRAVENSFTKTRHGACRCIRDLVGGRQTGWVMPAAILHRTGPISDTYKRGITAPRQSANRPAIEKRKAAGMLTIQHAATGFTLPPGPVESSAGNKQAHASLSGDARRQNL